MNRIDQYFSILKIELLPYRFHFVKHKQIHHLKHQSHLLVGNVSISIGCHLSIPIFSRSFILRLQSLPIRQI